MPRGRRVLKEARTGRYGSAEREQVNLPGKRGEHSRRWCEERGEWSTWRGMEVQGILDGAQGLSEKHGMKVGAAGVPMQGSTLPEMRVVK